MENHRDEVATPGDHTQSISDRLVLVENRTLSFGQQEPASSVRGRAASSRWYPQRTNAGESGGAQHLTLYCGAQHLALYCGPQQLAFYCGPQQLALFGGPRLVHPATRSARSARLSDTPASPLLFAAGIAASIQTMLRVSRLSIAPVRALGLQHPTSIEVDESGVREDRRFYLIDEHGHLVDRLRAGALVQVRAETDRDATWLRLTFPDGRRLEGDVTLDEPVRTYMYGREAVGRVVGGPWAAALEPFAHGRPVLLVRCDRPGGTRIRPGETEVRNAVSLVSDASIAGLARELGVERVDPRRFRMLIEVEGARAAHEEDTWIGGQVAVGSAVLRITKPDARCAITTQDPDTGVRDLDTLRTILRYRGFRANDDGKKIDFGVLGEVSVPGRITVGDEVRVVASVSVAARQSDAVA